MTSITIQNCLKSLVASSGISHEDIRLGAPALKAAADSLAVQRREGKLGFFDLPDQVLEAKKIETLAQSWKGRYDNFVVVGIGGSALGNIALQTALRHPNWNLLSKEQRKGWLKVFVPDNVDPSLISGLQDVLDIRKTLFNVVSKSGTTAECLANYFIFKKALEKKVGKSQAAKQIIFTTDPHKGYLREAGQKEGILTLDIPPNVGGRFSVLSTVGLLSAAAACINISGLLDGARKMRELCETLDISKNPAALYAWTHKLFYDKGRKIHVMIPYSNELKDMADWFRQLWAESLGKAVNRKGRKVFVGPTPVKALGATDQHSQIQLYIEGPQDKLLTFLSVDDLGGDVKIPSYDSHYLGGKTLGALLKAEESATRAALTKSERPNLTVSIPKVTPESVGELIFLFELATAYSGEFFDLNAYDQPGVEEGKILTYALMGRNGYKERLKDYAKYL
jgi:glucose-6-phosphate isomerase